MALEKERVLRKAKREAAKMALEVLAFMACICLAEGLAGSGWGYIVLAIVATLAANCCAGAALKGEEKQ